MSGTVETFPAAQQGAAMEAADIGLLFSSAFELGETIKNSALTREYLFWKSEVTRDDEARKLSIRFAKAKEKFAECERFGRFHPDYNEALDEVYALESQLDELDSVRNYKAAESTLDLLLNEVSRTLAYAVSSSIKVPDNDPNPKGCGNGGKCSCGSGGCG